MIWRSETNGQIKKNTKFLLHVKVSTKGLVALTKQKKTHLHVNCLQFSVQDGGPDVT